jgi:hypothetical protein
MVAMRMRSIETMILAQPSTGAGNWYTVYHIGKLN